jgi:hypothetical protein
MTFIWQWPQLVWLGLTICGLTISLFKHGEPKGHHNFFTHLLIALPLGVALLYYGGFFTEVRP